MPRDWGRKDFRWPHFLKKYTPTLALQGSSNLNIIYNPEYTMLASQGQTPLCKNLVILKQVTAPTLQTMSTAKEWIIYLANRHPGLCLPTTGANGCTLSLALVLRVYPLDLNTICMPHLNQHGGIPLITCPLNLFLPQRSWHRSTVPYTWHSHMLLRRSQFGAKRSSGGPFFRQLLPCQLRTSQVHLLLKFLQSAQIPHWIHPA